MKHRILSFLLIALSTMLLPACTQIHTHENITPKINARVIRLPTSEKFQNAISLAKKGKEGIHPLYLTEVTNGELLLALEDSLINNGYLSQATEGRYLLNAKIIDQIKLPSLGINFTYESTIKYNLIDKTNGSIVYENKITTSGKSEFSDTIVGAERMRIANENSVKNNIKTFMRALAHIE